MPNTLFTPAYSAIKPLEESHSVVTAVTEIMDIFEDLLKISFITVFIHGKSVCGIYLLMALMVCEGSIGTKNLTNAKRSITNGTDEIIIKNDACAAYNPILSSIIQFVNFQIPEKNFFIYFIKVLPNISILYTNIYTIPFFYLLVQYLTSFLIKIKYKYIDFLI